jgi:hypothetical protein
VQRTRLRLLIKERLRAAAVLAEKDEGGAELGDAGAEALQAFVAEQDEFFGGAGGGPSFGEEGYVPADEDPLEEPPQPLPQPRAVRRAAAVAAPRTRPPPAAAARARGASAGAGAGAAGTGAKRSREPVPRTAFVASWDVKKARIANGGVAPAAAPARPKMHVRFEGEEPPPLATRKPAAAAAARPRAAAPPPPPPKPKAPLRSRAEGGRKRRSKKS